MNGLRQPNELMRISFTIQKRRGSRGYQSLGKKLAYFRAILPTVCIVMSTKVAQRARFWAPQRARAGSKRFSVGKKIKWALLSHVALPASAWTNGGAANWKFSEVEKNQLKNAKCSHFYDASRCIEFSGYFWKSCCEKLSLIVYFVIWIQCGP